MREGVLRFGNGSLDSAQLYGAEYSEPLQARVAGKPAGGYSIDMTQPGGMTPTEVVQASRVSPLSAFHPRTSLTFWLLLGVGVLIYTRGHLKLSRKR